MIELSRGGSGGLFDLVGSGKTLASQRITAEEPPPALRAALRKPRPCRNEDVLEARMLGQPGAGLGTVMEARDYR